MSSAVNQPPSAINIDFCFLFEAPTSVQTKMLSSAVSLIGQRMTLNRPEYRAHNYNAPLTLRETLFKVANFSIQKHVFKTN